MYSGKVAVVTGGGAGLGRELALGLAARGARVAVCDLNGDWADETAGMVRASGGEALAEAVDVGDSAAMGAFAGRVAGHFGAVHQLYNNAGIAIEGKPITRLADDEIEKVLRVNLWGAFNGTRAFLPHLKDSGDGLLCNIASLNGMLALGGAAPYCASKSAVIGLTESVRIEMLQARAPVAVALVLPGGIATDIARRLPPDWDDLTPERQAQIKAQIDENYRKYLKMPPEVAARDILKKLARGRRRITVTPKAYWLDLLVRAIPAQYPKLVAGAMRG